MTDLHPGVVQEIVIAIRTELKALLPNLLASVLEEVKEASVRDKVARAHLRLSRESLFSATQAACLPSTSPQHSETTELYSEHGSPVRLAHRTNLASALESPMNASCSSQERSPEPNRTSAHSGYAPLLEESSEINIISNISVIDSERARSIEKEISTLKAKVNSANTQMEDLDTLWRNRRRQYEEDVINCMQRITEKRQELDDALAPKGTEEAQSGPAFLSFVESTWFGVVCNVIISLNLIAMVLHQELPKYSAVFKLLNNLFLIWYVLELTAKAAYYQKAFFCGSISVVWWNYLDLCVVVGGILDKMQRSGSNLAVMRIFRLFRLFRLLRFLKILKMFFKSDLAWVEGSAFQGFMFFVIALNCSVIGLELDMEWVGWKYIENLFLVVYTFELAVQLKRQKCGFLTDLENAFYNYLDIVMVVGGVLNQWLMPLIVTVGGMLAGKSSHISSHSAPNLLRLLRILRIARVLRLLRLLRMIKPLHRVLAGVKQSVKAMQWVLVLTLLTLYACAIVFTSFVGKGWMSDGVVSGEIYEHYGSIPRSMFSLFRLMNGDLTVVGSITQSITGRLLFISFTVVSNWAILAVLTSVVSDNIISSSARLQEEDDAREREKDHAKRLRRLMTLFREMDDHGSGYIGKRDWNALLADRTLRREIKDASGLSEIELQDCFDSLALADTEGVHGMKLPYNDFYKILEAQGRAPDKSTILHVVLQLRALESRFVAKLSESRHLKFKL